MAEGAADDERITPATSLVRPVFVRDLFFPFFFAFLPNDSLGTVSIVEHRTRYEKTRTREFFNGPREKSAFLPAVRSGSKRRKLCRHRAGDTVFVHEKVAGWILNVFHGTSPNDSRNSR